MILNENIICLEYLNETSYLQSKLVLLLKNKVQSPQIK